MGRVRKGEGVSMVKGVERVLPISLPGVKKLLHNINTHRIFEILFLNKGSNYFINRYTCIMSLLCNFSKILA
jgi:hypothetical protein